MTASYIDPLKSSAIKRCVRFNKENCALCWLLHVVDFPPFFVGNVITLWFHHADYYSFYFVLKLAYNFSFVNQNVGGYLEKVCGLKCSAGTIYR